MSRSTLEVAASAAGSSLKAEVWLRRLLIGMGCLLLTALSAVFLPTPFMAIAHERLGMGEFPDTTLVEYLTRSIAALYAFHGGFLLLAAADVRRYRPIVSFIGWGDIGFGLLITGIDLEAGMPLSWTAGEGPGLLLGGAIILLLVRSVPRQ